MLLEHICMLLLPEDHCLIVAAWAHLYARPARMCTSSHVTCYHCLHNSGAALHSVLGKCQATL